MRLTSHAGRSLAAPVSPLGECSFDSTAAVAGSHHGLTLEMNSV